MKLFDPGKIGKLETKNRIGMAPLGFIADFVDSEGRLTQRAIDYYEARAEGGTGLIITGTSRVNSQIDCFPGLPRVMAIDTSKETAVQLEKLTKTVHRYGAKIVFSLTAGMGRCTFRALLAKGGIPMAPSPLPCFWEPKVMTREMTIEEIQKIVHDFGIAAEVLRNAGADGIDIHGHEGYLLDQFKTALWNKRTDEYGGNLDRRLRFPIEIIQSVKKRAGADFPVIYRYGLNHYLAGGREIEEGLEVARRLEAAGADALDIDAGCYETWYWPHPPTTQPPGCMVDLAEKTKKVVRIPVLVAGRLGYPELAERVVHEGKADFVLLGRPLLSDPEWPNKVKEGRLKDICPCLGCHECLKMDLELKYLSCAVNPATGKEAEYKLRPAKKKKRVLVVGGGPGGMEAARVTALRGHEVILWEEGNALGGNLIPASSAKLKQDYKYFMDYLSNQVKNLGVRIELGKEATPELIQGVKPDVVFIATGAKPVVPDIPGVEKKKVVTAIDVLLGKGKAGKTVVVIGGGMVGSEIALDLAQKGKQVTIVEILDSIARDVYTPNRQHLLKLLSESNVKMFTDTNVLEITDEGIIMADKSGKRNNLRADTVVIAVGLKSEDGKLPSALNGKIPEVYTIGDCVEPRKIINAIWEAFGAARLV